MCVCVCSAFLPRCCPPSMPHVTTTFLLTHRALPRSHACKESLARSLKSQRFQLILFHTKAVGQSQFAISEERAAHCLIAARSKRGARRGRERSRIKQREGRVLFPFLPVCHYWVIMVVMTLQLQQLSALHTQHVFTLFYSPLVSPLSVGSGDLNQSK